MISYKVRVARVEAVNDITLTLAIREDFKHLGYKTGVAIGMMLGIPIIDYNKARIVKVGQMLEGHGIEVVITRIQEVTMPLGSFLE